MPTKTVIVALLSTTLLLGAVMSGCKRNRDDGLASAQSRRRTSRQHEVSSVRNVRPAEVLSASAYRPAVRRRQTPLEPQPRQPRFEQQDYNNYRRNHQDQASYQPPRRQSAYEPLPEPVPVSQLAVAPSAFQYSAAQPVNYSQPAYAAAAPVYVAQPYSQPVQAQPTYAQPAAPAQPEDSRYSHLPEYAYKPQQRNGRPDNPDLAMARARLAPLQARQTSHRQRTPSVEPIQQVQHYNNGGAYNYNYSSNSAPVPGVVPSQFNAPIPELEPVRYQRVAAAPAQARRRVPEIAALPQAKQPRQQQQVAAYITGREQSEVARALAPINQAPGQHAHQAQPVQSAEWVASGNTSAPLFW